MRGPVQRAGGRDARAAGAVEGPTEESLHLRHEDTCVVYTAESGSECRIDVETMQRVDVQTGVRRAVFRKHWKTNYGYGKLPLWEFEDEARNSTPPKCVTAALEERWGRVWPSLRCSPTKGRAMCHVACADRHRDCRQPQQAYGQAQGRVP